MIKNRQGRGQGANGDDGQHIAHLRHETVTITGDNKATAEA
jgi:hypothetical protein